MLFRSAWVRFFAMYSPSPLPSVVLMKEMAAMYGYDISMPAKNTREAIQWTYFAYLASIKEQNDLL